MEDATEKNGRPYGKSVYNFDELSVYLTTNAYPDWCKGKRGLKSNFRTKASKFKIVNAELVYLHKVSRKTSEVRQLKVVRGEAEQKWILKMCHDGQDSSAAATAMGGHIGRDKTLWKIMERFWWPSVKDEVAVYVSTCDRCQKANTRFEKTAPEMHPIPVEATPWKQIGIDICCLKATPDGFCYIVVVVDYFTKWIESKALKDKTAVSVAQFLYECICRHGVPAIQINDQGREFVNSVSSELHRLTGTEQRITSAYHPQANGLVERNNRTIQNSLLKVLNQKPEDWPDALPGVLFAYNTSRHKSTKYTPFFLLYGRDAVLPVHVSNHAIEEEVSEDTIDSTDTAAVQARVDDMIKIRQQIFPAAKKNIDSAQARQQRDYRTRHRNKATFSIGDNVLVWDSRRSSRKGGKDSDPWKGPYVVASVSQNSLCQVKTIKSLETLKTKYHTCNLKKYNMPSPKSPANPSSPSSVSPPSASVTLLPPPPKVPRPLSAFTHQPGSDSSSSEDDDIVTTTSTTSTLRFTPTDSNWRNHAAHKLGLPIRKGRFTSRMASTIGEPRIIDHILGDGNCLFRALSKEVTGTEKHHMTVRNKVVSVLENPSHTKNFESYSGHADMTEYVSKSRMGDNATWATYIEILAAASLLDTPIVIHTQLSTGKKWLKYDPLCVVPPVVDTELCIYLTNYHEHFNRVVSISK